MPNVIGTAASETLTGTLIADRIEGRAGADTLRGLNGDDTYVWSLGDGNDRVEEPSWTDTPYDGGFDVLELGPGILPGEVTLSRPGNRTLGDLVLTFEITSEEITLASQFSYIAAAAEQSAAPTIEEIRFANGAIWTAEDLVNRFLQSTSGDDVITGFARRNDRLDGGAGDDFLEGLSGFDTYVFGRGYGVDRVYDRWGIAEGFPGDGIEFKLGVAPEDIVFERLENDALNGVDVVFGIAGTGDRLVVENAAYSIDKVSFEGDFQYWSMDYVHARYAATHSTAGDDVFLRLRETAIDTGDGDDRIVGAINHARLTGGGGDDTYVFWRNGHGRDTVLESGDIGDIDTIEFLDAHSPGEFFVYLAANGRDLILSPGGGGRIVVKDALIAANYGVDQIRFAGGALWDRSMLLSQAEDLPATGVLLNGTAGADVLTGTGTFDGLGGDDVLEGFGEEDIYLYRAGSGNDRIVEGYGEGGDTVRLEGLARSAVTIARVGSDLTITINATGEMLTVQDQFTSAPYSGVEEIIFGDGSVLEEAAFSLPSSQAGTTSDDIVTGDSGNNRLQGMAGDDTIRGLNGNDTLEGGSGDDTLTGGMGNDRIDGGTGVDVVNLNGVPSNFAVSRTANGSIYVDDRVGTDGGDTLTGVEQVHFLGDSSTFNLSDLVADYGTGSNDGWIEGTTGADFLYGLAGDDVLAGRAGNDVYDGGEGDDTASVLGAGSHYTLLRNADGSVAITALVGSEGADLLRNIEGIYFEGDQTYRSIESLVGQYGTRGSDGWVEGSANGDALYGLDGNDTLVGRAGDDQLNGGDGYDQANYIGAFTDFVFTRRANGSITVTDTVGGEGTDTLIDLEAVYFAGDQTWAEVASLVANYGTAGDDAWVEGTDFGDHVYGLGGDDSLVGRGGDDFLYGGDGFDQANYFGASTDFSFVLNTDGTITVTDLVGTEGIDILDSLEAVYFDGDQVWSTLDDMLLPAGASSARIASEERAPMVLPPLDAYEPSMADLGTAAHLSAEYLFA